MLVNRRAFTRSLAGAGAVLASSSLTACIATNPATGRTSFTGMYSLKDDIALGTREQPKLAASFGGAYEDRRLSSYITQVGRKLAAGTEYSQLPYSFTVLNSPIVNAFALPGGYVNITRGLLALASNEAEMAGVLSHELGHVNARHTAERQSSAMLVGLGAAVLGAVVGTPGVQQLVKVGANAFIQGFSRSQEFEADTLGVRYMSRAGYDPEAMVTFLSTLREHSQLDAKMQGLPEGQIDQYNIMSTHPRTVDRIRAAMQEAAVATPPSPVVGRNSYLNAIDGMIYGDDTKDGVVSGHTFSHPGLRFSFQVPEGFRVVNQERQVLASHSNGTIIVFDMARQQRTRSLDDYLTKEWANNFQLQQVQRFQVNGLESATGMTRQNTRNGLRDLRLVALRGDDNMAFRLLFMTPPQITASMDQPLRQSVQSFHRLTPRQADAIKPLRIRVVPAASQSNLHRLAQKLPFGAYNDDSFRLLNDLAPGQSLPRNGRLKTVS